MRSILSSCVLLWTAAVCGQEPGNSRLAENYGFLPVEVTRLSQRMTSLQAADFNDDGRTDLILIDNDKHRLNLLIQRALPDVSAQARTVGLRDANRIEDHWRFENRKIPVDQEVVALTHGDFNNDGRQDIAYFGSPDQLVVRYQTDDGQWNSKWQIRLPEIAAATWCLSSGDLNGDGRSDLVILGKNDTLLFLQPEVGEFGPPVKLMNTSSQLALIQAADLNDDGLDDLCYLAGEAVNRSLGIRLQTLDGQMGPEYLFDLERPRAVSVRDVDGDGSAEILTIDSRTGRLKVLKVRFADLEADHLPDRLVRYGFGKRGTGRNRDLAIGDFDGNGKQDLVVSDPEASRLLLFRQFPERGLDLGTPYPGLTGSGALRAARLEPGGLVQLFVQSDGEKAIGQSHWEQQRLSFPQALPLEIEPVGMELVDLQRTGHPSLLVLTREKDGRNSSYSLAVFRQTEGGVDWEPDPAYKQPIGPLSLKNAPEQLLLAQLTGDDRPELLIFQGAKPPVVIGAGTGTGAEESGLWKELTTTGSLAAGSIPAGAVFPGEFNGQHGLVLAQDNYVRLMVLNADLRWEVADQVNAGESQAKIAGAALLNLDSQPGDELVMVDTGVKKLRVLRLEENRYQPWKEVELGEFSFKAARVADMNGDGRPDLLLFGEDQCGILYAGGITPALEEIATYESVLEHSFPTDMLAGDLNGDGQSNLAIMDTRNRRIEVLEYRPPSQLERAMYFTVFDEKGFAHEEGTGSDPREGVIADVTGDGRADLVLLVHDRVLVYPQDTGVPQK